MLQIIFNFFLALINNLKIFLKSANICQICVKQKLSAFVATIQHTSNVKLFTKKSIRLFL